MAAHARWIPVVAALAFVPAAKAQDVRVTVVAIAATDRNAFIDPKLAEIAREVKKHDSSLTGFRIERTTTQEFNVGQKQSLKLIDDSALDVTATAKDDGKQRVRLTVKPPSVGEIVYITGYDKYFPIVTRYTAKTGERLIVAIMVKAAAKDKEAK